MLREIREDLKFGKNNMFISCNTVNMSFTPKLVHRWNAIPIRIPTDFWHWEAYYKIYGKFKELRIALANLKQKNKVGKHISWLQDLL